MLCASHLGTDITRHCELRSLSALDTSEAVVTWPEDLSGALSCTHCVQVDNLHIRGQRAHDLFSEHVKHQHASFARWAKGSPLA